MEKKVALVTGASRGIGRQISLKLAKEGMFVVVNYCGSEARAKDVLEEIRKNGGDGVLYQCDVADYQQTETMAKELIKSYGHVDVLVNNAGITRDNLILRMSEEEFDAVVETNLKGCFHTIRHLSRYFLKQKSGKSSTLHQCPVCWEMQDRQIMQHRKQELSGLQRRWRGNWQAEELQSMR